MSCNARRPAWTGRPPTKLRLIYGGSPNLICPRRDSAGRQFPTRTAVTARGCLPCPTAPPRLCHPARQTRHPGRRSTCVSCNARRPAWTGRPPTKLRLIYGGSPNLICPRRDSAGRQFPTRTAVTARGCLPCPTAPPRLCHPARQTRHPGRRSTCVSCNARRPAWTGRPPTKLRLIYGGSPNLICPRRDSAGRQFPTRTAVTARGCLPCPTAPPRLCHPARQTRHPGRRSTCVSCNARRPAWTGRPPTKLRLIYGGSPNLICPRRDSAGRQATPAANHLG